jgi:ABC-type transport system involved in multi-copper enzyme maturation permease subunit
VTDAGMIWIVLATWMEIWRKRAVLVTWLLSAGALGLFLLFVHYQTMSDAGGLAFGPYIQATVAAVLGLYLVNFTVAYLSIFSAAGTISAEAETGLLQAIVPRAVPRWQIYLGKWLGYATWSLTYGAIMFWAVILIVHAQLSYPLHLGELLRAFGCFELVPLCLVTVTVFGSLFLSAMGNGIGVTLLYMVSVIGGFLSRVTFHPTQFDLKVVLFTGLLMPADALYHRMVFELLGGATAPQIQFLGPLNGQDIVPGSAFVLYSGAYILGLLALGMWQFSRQDL